MIFLTEQQRIEALDICERIEALNAKMQMHARAALEILERASRGQSAVGDRDTRAASTTSA